MTDNQAMLGCDIHNPSPYQKHLAKVTFAFLETLVLERTQYGFSIKVLHQGFQIDILHNNKIIYTYYPASYIFIDYVSRYRGKGYPKLISVLKAYFRKNKEENRRNSSKQLRSVSFLKKNNFFE